MLNGQPCFANFVGFTFFSHPLRWTLQGDIHSWFYDIGYQNKKHCVPITPVTCSAFFPLSLLIFIFENLTPLNI